MELAKPIRHVGWRILFKNRRAGVCSWLAFVRFLSALAFFDPDVRIGFWRKPVLEWNDCGQCAFRFSALASASPGEGARRRAHRGPEPHPHARLSGRAFLIVHLY